MSGTHASARKSFRLTKRMARAYDETREGVDRQAALACIARELQRRKHRHKLRMRRPIDAFNRTMKRIFETGWLERAMFDESPFYVAMRMRSAR